MKTFQSIALLAFIVLLSPGHSSIVVDIEKGPDSVRVVGFDTKKQELLAYRTQPLEGFDRSLKDLVFDLHYAGNQLPMQNTRVKFEGEHLQLENFLPFSAVQNQGLGLIVICNKQILGGNADLLQKDKVHKRWWTSASNIAQKTPDQLNLPVRKKCKKPAAMPITRHDHEGGDTVASLSSDDKGVLGELVTQMTMLSYGYLAKPSIFNSNNGLDGLYVGFDATYMIMTESKADEGKRVAKTVTDNNLNEKLIDKRLDGMAGSGIADVVASQELVVARLQENPESIFKMSQSLRFEGNVDTHVEALDTSKLPAGKYKMIGQSPVKKADHVRKTVEGYTQTPVQAAILALSAIDTSQVPLLDAIALLTQRYNENEQLDD